MKTVAILYGGRSGEHEVSLMSGGAVFSNIDRSLYDTILIAVDHDGIWYLQENPGFQEDNKSLVLEKKDNIVTVIPGMGLYCKNNRLKIDVVFPVLHGTFGEDGTLQGLLDMAGLPYAGSSVLGSAIGMDKAVAKQIWMHSGLPVVPFMTIKNLYNDDIEDSLDRAIREFDFPLFVKPANAGSSLGVTKVNTRAELAEGVKSGFNHDKKLLIEPAVIGREIECSVIGNSNPVSYLPGEVISGDYYDYDSKYIHPENVNLLVPADLTAALKKEVKEIAEKAFLSIGAEGFARVDFFIEKETNKVLINEINTLPGFTEISMFAKLCDISGLPYKDMLTKIINLAEEKFERKNKLIFRKD